MADLVVEGRGAILRMRPQSRPHSPRGARIWLAGRRERGKPNVVGEICVEVRDRFLADISAGGGFVAVASDINRGECVNFASEVMSKGGRRAGAEMFYDRDADHAYIRFRGHYYDAECPLGTRTRADLPFYRKLAQIYLAEDNAWRNRWKRNDTK